LGSTLRLTASTSRGGNFVVLDVHNRINELLESAPSVVGHNPPATSTEDVVPEATFALKDPKQSALMATIQLPTPLSPRELAAVVDRPAYETYQLSTTVRCPKDRIVLVGGMEGVGDAAGGRNMYLFCRVSVYDIVLDDATHDTVESKTPRP
jgi:hypothetical protein